MSELREYLEFIRPWNDPSYKVVTSQWTPPDKTAKQFLIRGAQAIDDIIAIIQYYDNRGENVWFSVQRFDDNPARAVIGKGKWFKNVNRKVGSIVEHYCFYADLDVKPHAYPTLQDAANAILTFCQLIGLPPPSLLVCSGYGLHVYWRIEEPMTYQQWQPLANALRAAMQQQGIHADHGVTVDAARILRPPGTRNWKDPKDPKTTYIIPGSSKQIYPLDWFATPLRIYMGPHIATVGGKVVGPAPATGPGHVNQNLSAGVNQSQPVDLHAVAAECPMLANEFATAGATTTQPLWHLVALASAFDVNPWKTFNELSRGYPNYDPAAAQAMLAIKEQNKQRGVGWPSCDAFANESPLCKACPHLAVHTGSNKGPLHIRLLPSNALKGNPNNLPPGYWQDQDGVVMTTISEKNSTHDVKVFGDHPYPVWDGGIDFETGDLIFKTTIGGEDRYVSVPESATNSTKIREALYTQSIHFYDRPHLNQRAGDFIVAWVTHLKAAGVKHDKVSLGWNYGPNFTFADKTWIAGVPYSACVSDPKTCEFFGVKGDPKYWRELVDKFILTEHVSLHAALATSFAAPLIETLGSSVMLSFIGPSGCGKTTALRAAAAVWGNPTQVMSAVDDTIASLMKKMTEVPNMPRYWDEVRDEVSLDKVVTTAFRLGQGRDKDRLTQTIESRSGGSFSTVLVLASNTSIADIVTKKTLQSEAGALRVFEIEVPKISSQTKYNVAPQYLQHDLDRNYGHIGEQYAAWLSNNKANVAKGLKQIQDAVSTKLGDIKEERFWHQAIAALVGAAHFATKIGLAKFDANALMDFLISEAVKLRSEMKVDVEAVTNPTTLEEIIDEIIHDPGTIHTEGRQIRGKGVPLKIVWPGLPEVQKMKYLWAQWDTQGKVLRVTKRGFDKFLMDRGQQTRLVMNALRKLGAVAEGGRFAIGAGVQLLSIFDDARPRSLDIYLGVIQKAKP